MHAILTLISAGNKETIRFKITLKIMSFVRHALKERQQLHNLSQAIMNSINDYLEQVSHGIWSPLKQSGEPINQSPEPKLSVEWIWGGLNKSIPHRVNRSTGDQIVQA